MFLFHYSGSVRSATLRENFSITGQWNQIKSRRKLLMRLTVFTVANLVTYLCSPLSSATNGAALPVNGGVVRACFWTHW